MTTPTETTAHMAVQELTDVEQEIATVVQAIADLYTTPATTGATYQLQQQTRESLEARLDALRARMLELNLVCSAHAYAAVSAALEHGQAELDLAEAAYAEAERRVTAARLQVEILADQERNLREQRLRLRNKLTACLAPAGNGKVTSAEPVVLPERYLATLRRFSSPSPAGPAGQGWEDA
jgi:hypothetical protein